MKHHDFKAIASLSGAFDEVGNPGLMHSFEYPVLDGFALDRNARTVSEIAEIPESFLFGGTK